MKTDEIIEKLKNIVKPYVNDQKAFDGLNENTDLSNDLHINSANIIDIILDIEEEFKIIIDNQSMENLLDIKSAITIIEAKLSEK